MNGCISSRHLKALIKLSRKLAILEFSSANGYTSFSLDFECRLIRIIETENENQSHFFHFGLSLYPWYGYNDTDIICEERGFEKWEIENGFCTTTFEGQECSIIKSLGLEYC